jgi:hypothetical protein
MMCVCVKLGHTILIMATYIIKILGVATLVAKKVALG